MPRLILSILLATTAVAPAIAQHADRDHRAEEREQRRAKQAEARNERAEPREVAHPERVQQTERVQRNAAAREHQLDEEPRAANVNERGRPTLNQRTRARDQAAAARQLRTEEARQERRDSRAAYVDRMNHHRVAAPAGAHPDHPAPPPAHGSHAPAPQWHTTWRQDHQHDWRHWRDQHRSLFQLGAYFDPFGWSYRRYGIGWRLWPSYYSSSYWLDDPIIYRLPNAPWPYRWVRYYDDALLVNTMSGQVVDVIHEFFW